MCSQRPRIHIQTPTRQDYYKLHALSFSLRVSALSSSVNELLISAAACHLSVTLPLPSICFCVFQSQCCHSLFLMPHPATLSVRVTRGGWWRTILQRTRSGFCKCKQLILSRPAGCSAQLSVNRREIMFIRARNRCIPLTDTTAPPATNSFSSTSLILYPPPQPLSALSPETGCSL